MLTNGKDSNKRVIILWEKPPRQGIHQGQEKKELLHRQETLNVIGKNMQAL